MERCREMIIGDVERILKKSWIIFFNYERSIIFAAPKEMKG